MAIMIIIPVSGGKDSHYQAYYRPRSWIKAFILTIKYLMLEKKNQKNMRNVFDADHLILVKRRCVEKT